MAKDKQSDVYILLYGGVVKGVFQNIKICYQQLQAELSIINKEVPLSYSQVCRRMEKYRKWEFTIPGQYEYKLYLFPITKTINHNLFSK